MTLKLSLAIVALGAVSASHAAINWHNSLASWNAATGGAMMTEDLSGFGADTQFRTASVGIAMGSIAQEGFDQAFRNEVDVSPTTFADNNGTNHLSMYTNFTEVATAGTTVRLTLSGAMTAFGAETWGANDLEGAVMDVYDGATLLGSMALTTGAGDFLGFDLTGGDVVTSIVWRSGSLVAGGGGEGFGMDNLVVAGVPEPATMTMLSLGALAAWRRKNRK